MRVCLVFLALLCVAGCADSTWTRVSVDGTVSINGEPIKLGSISFLPAKNHTGPAATAVIENGAFHLDGEAGPVSGSHTVLINVDVDDKRAMVESHNIPNTSRVPTKTRWEQSVEIPDQGHFQLELNLQ